jgi:hypothetical protein
MIGGMAMKETTSMNTDTVSLVDIRDVSVDKNLTREERVAEFVRQIKNPYCFRCGRFTVRAQFAENGATLEDCLKRILI